MTSAQSYMSFCRSAIAACNGHPIVLMLLLTGSERCTNRDITTFNRDYHVVRQRIGADAGTEAYT